MSKKLKKNYNAGTLLAFCLLVLWLPAAYIFDDGGSFSPYYWLPLLIPLFAFAVFVAGKVERKWTIKRESAEQIFRVVGWFNIPVAFFVGMISAEYGFFYLDELLLLLPPLLTAGILYAQSFKQVKQTAVISVLALVLGIVFSLII